MHATTKSGRFIGFKHLKKPLSNQRLTKQPNQTSMTTYDKTYRYYKINSEKLPNKKITTRRTNSNKNSGERVESVFQNCQYICFEIPNFQKIARYSKKQESMAHIQKKKGLLEIVSKEKSSIGFIRQNLKSTILNMFKELK